MTRAKQAISHSDRLAQLYSHLLDADVAAVRALFPGPAALDSPQACSVQGDVALNQYVVAESQWLAQHNARVVIVSMMEDADHAAVEVLVYFTLDSIELDLPVALIGQKVPDGFGQIRIYHSTWPLHGRHAYRAPIVWPRGTIQEPPIMEAYFTALNAGNEPAILATFTTSGYVREPSGSRYTHAGQSGRQAFYSAVTAHPGGVGLTHATTTFDGSLFAVEYFCDRWGESRFAPMAGCAFYELSEDTTRIAAVRIYDDISPPGE